MGKPSAILLDFNEYERIIEEYINFKNNKDFVSNKKTSITKNNDISDDEYKASFTRNRKNRQKFRR